MRTVNLEAVLADQRIGRTHLLALALCTLVMVIDGFDVFIIGKLAPAIAATFGRPVSAMTLVFVLQQAGLAIGAFLIGPLADRYGRRGMLILCTLLFSVFTLLSLLASTITEFALYRAAAGLFLSGVIPNVVALMSELAPARLRARFVTIAFCGYSAGNVCAAAFVATFLDRFGWHGGFLTGGLLPLLLVPLLVLWLPESVHYRAGRNGRDPRIARTLARIAPDFTPAADDHYVASGAGRSGGGARWNLLNIFRGPLALATVLIWLSYVFALGNVALLGSWVATFFNQLGGVSLKDFAAASVVGFIGGLIGMLSVGFLMDRLGSLRVLPLIFVLNGIATIASAYVPFGTIGFMLVLLIWYFCQSGGQAGLNALAATYYPPHIRSTGVGWAFGAGRLGGVVAPLFGGLALTSHLSLQAALFYVALPSFFVGIMVLLLCLFRPSGGGAPIPAR